MFFSYEPLESTLGAESGSGESSLGWRFRDIFVIMSLHPHCTDQGLVAPQLREKTQNSLAFSSSILPFQLLWDGNRFATVVHKPRGKTLCRNIIIGITNKNSHYHCCPCDYCNWWTTKIASDQAKTLTYVLSLYIHHNSVKEAWLLSHCTDKVCGTEITDSGPSEIPGIIPMPVY